MGGIRAVILDFGGVVAEEGFREGLMAIARRCGLDEAPFFERASELAYSSGYVTGAIDEVRYWQLLRIETGITLADTELRAEILDRFVIRPVVIELAADLRAAGVIVAMLTDQTNWLAELDRRDGFLALFDRVFNSFDMGMSKREQSVFAYVCTELGVSPEEALFVDDNPGHVERAHSSGLNTVLFGAPGASVAAIRASVDFAAALAGEAE